MVSSVFKPVEDDLITLDDILNLWDGLEETAGRILIISSNHYNDLDPALTRPGRIDITIEMKNASHEIIAEMYQHLFETKIDAKLLEKVTPRFYSPAEIVNLYLMYKDDANGFMERLILNKKV
jgi:SpoVK/Ycf46/Vps4 family AAA+-type ATPase